MNVNTAPSRATAVTYPSDDMPLLSACECLARASARQEAFNAADDWDENEANCIRENWYEALSDINAAGAPTTAEGKRALARAALLALEDLQVILVGEEEANLIRTALAAAVGAT